MTRATLGEPVLRDDAIVPVVQPLPAPVWYKASADGFDVQPPKRKILKGDPVSGGYVRHRSIQLRWLLMMGGIAPTPQPGGMGSAPIQLPQVRGWNLYVGSLPLPGAGQPVPVPTVPTTPSLTLTTPDMETVLRGYYVPAPPPVPPAPQDLPIWTPIKPATAYAVQIVPIGLDGKESPNKSVVLQLQTPDTLPPPNQQIGTLSTPSGLGFQPGTRVPNPAGGIPGVFYLQWNAVRDVDGYEVVVNNNPRPGMGAPGLLEGDRVIATAVQPALVDSQVPIKATSDLFSVAGQYCNLRVRAFKTVQDNLKAYGAFSAPLTTILPKTSVPDQPTSLRLFSPATTTTVPVTWNPGGAASPPVEEYRIYESGVFRISVKAPAVTATVPGYSAGQAYKLTCRAVSTAGESAPSTVLEGTTAPA